MSRVTRWTAAAVLVFGLLFYGLMLPSLSAGKAERHPRIRTAIRAMEEAKQELKKAAHDFGGHRLEAIGALDKAIRQLEICLKYDKK